MYQVTSRGCSRGYVLCVLWRALEHVQRLYSNNKPVCFPFLDADINKWLVAGRTDCVSASFQNLFGGVDFYPDDPCTFWTLPSHFCTWWKNNVERKSKSLSLLKDAVYNGSDEKLIARALYCKLAVILSMNIKNHFTRVINQQIDKRVVQVTIPPIMPSHMVFKATPNTSAQYIVVANCDDFLSDLLASKLTTAQRGSARSSVVTTSRVVRSRAATVDATRMVQSDEDDDDDDGYKMPVVNGKSTRPRRKSAPPAVLTSGRQQLQQQSNNYHHQRRLSGSSLHADLYHSGSDYGGDDDDNNEDSEVIEVVPLVSAQQQPQQSKRKRHPKASQASLAASSGSCDKSASTHKLRKLNDTIPPNSGSNSGTAAAPTRGKRGPYAKRNTSAKPQQVQQQIPQGQQPMNGMMSTSHQSHADGGLYLSMLDQPLFNEATANSSTVGAHHSSTYRPGYSYSAAHSPQGAYLSNTQQSGLNSSQKTTFSRQVYNIRSSDNNSGVVGGGGFSTTGGFVYDSAMLVNGRNLYLDDIESLQAFSPLGSMINSRSSGHNGNGQNSHSLLPLSPDQQYSALQQQQQQHPLRRSPGNVDLNVNNQNQQSSLLSLSADTLQLESPLYHMSIRGGMSGTGILLSPGSRPHSLMSHPSASRQSRGVQPSSFAFPVDDGDDDGDFRCHNTGGGDVVRTGAATAIQPTVVSSGPLASGQGTQQWNEETEYHESYRYTATPSNTITPTMHYHNIDHTFHDYTFRNSRIDTVGNMHTTQNHPVVTHKGAGHNAEYDPNIEEACRDLYHLFHSDAAYSVDGAFSDDSGTAAVGGTVSTDMNHHGRENNEQAEHADSVMPTAQRTTNSSTNHYFTALITTDSSSSDPRVPIKKASSFRPVVSPIETHWREPVSDALYQTPNNTELTPTSPAASDVVHVRHVVSPPEDCYSRIQLGTESACVSGGSCIMNDVQHHHTMGGLTGGLSSQHSDASLTQLAANTDRACSLLMNLDNCHSSNSSNNNSHSTGSNLNAACYTVSPATTASTSTGTIASTFTAFSRSVSGGSAASSAGVVNNSTSSGHCVHGLSLKLPQQHHQQHQQQLYTADEMTDDTLCELLSLYDHSINLAGGGNE